MHSNFIRFLKNAKRKFGAQTYMLFYFICSQTRGKFKPVFLPVMFANEVN